MVDRPDIDLEDEGPPIGTVLEGRYELIDRLGEGGVGWVYRARHLRLGTEVAVKMLQSAYARHESLRPRFEREAKALAALRHPHIVSLTDYSVAEDGHPYLVMELLEGQTLGALIEHDALPEDRARRILSQILDALIYAHGRGFAHRDLKPNNVFLVELPTDPDHVKILDFGFVKLVRPDRVSEPGLTRSGMAFGTPSYMSPEQASGGATDARSDLYSAGVVFFEMLAGQRPYVGEIPDVIRQHLTEPVPSLNVGGLSIVASPELRLFLERAMAKEPRDRFQSAEEMKEALLALPERSVRARTRVDSKAPTMPPPPRPTVGSTQPTLPVQTPTSATASGGSEAPRAEASNARPGPPPGPSRPSAWLAIVGVLVVAAIAALVWTWVREDDAGSSPIGEPTEPEAPATIEPAEPEPTRETRTASPRSPRADDPSSPGEEAEEDWADITGIEEDPIEPLEPEPLEEPEAEEVAEPAGASEDPWQRLEAVPLLEEARAEVAAGHELSRARDRDLRRYVREHRDDPRPHLVLASSFVVRGHDLSAIQRYSLAHRVDPSARHDPRMLADLVALAARPVVTSDATELLARVYGAEAEPAIDRLLASDSLDAASADRLRAARAALRAPAVDAPP